MSGIFHSVKRAPLVGGFSVGCPTCAGVGDVTQDDLDRWQRGEFSWGDLFWCKANPALALAVLAGPLLPIIGAASLVTGNGRLPMNPNVPKVSVDLARVWPCLSEDTQRVVNQKAEEYASTSSTPSTAVTTPAASAAAATTPATAAETKSKNSQLLFLVVSAGLVGLAIMRSRRRSKSGGGRMLRNPGRSVALHWKKYGPGYGGKYSYVASLPSGAEYRIYAPLRGLGGKWGPYALYFEPPGWKQRQRIQGDYRTPASAKAAAQRHAKSQ